MIPPIHRRAEIVVVLLLVLAFNASFAFAAAAPSPSPTPLPSPLPKMSPSREQFVIERARLDHMERQAYNSTPDLELNEKRAEGLRLRMEKKQADTREAIDKYLKEHHWGKKELEGFRLDAITDQLMKIMPFAAVDNPKMKQIVIQSLKRDKKPPFPEDFAKKFGNKKPAEVPDEELFAFFRGHLQEDANTARTRLQSLRKEANPPQFMMESLEEITYIKCTLGILRAWLDETTPINLKAQREKVLQLQNQKTTEGIQQFPQKLKK